MNIANGNYTFHRLSFLGETVFTKITENCFFQNKTKDDVKFLANLLITPNMRTMIAALCLCRHVSTAPKKSQYSIKKVKTTRQILFLYM